MLKFIRRHKTALLERNMKVFFLQLIAEGVSEGLFHIPEDVSPSTSLQHLML
jgi:hypothetical protein